MTLILDAEEVTCSHCAQLKKTFILIAVSSVFVVVVVAVVLLILMSSEVESEIENFNGVLVEFVLGLVYVQLFVAACLLAVNILRRRHATFKFHLWYVVFHVTTMSLFLVTSFGMTLANKSYGLFTVVTLASITYYAVLYYYFKIRNMAWILFRNNY